MPSVLLRLGECKQILLGHFLLLSCLSTCLWKCCASLHCQLSQWKWCHKSLVIVNFNLFCLSGKGEKMGLINKEKGKRNKGWLVWTYRSEVKVTQSRPTLWHHGLSSPWNSPGQNTGVGSLSLLQGIFPTQGSNPGLPHCWQIFY